jgi:thymidylate synthase (FAD)
MPLLFYKPAEGNFALQSQSNRQGREGGAPAEVYREAVERWERLRAEAGDTYRWLLEEDVAREIARIDLPVSTYTQWYWKIDLHNLLHFLSLRADPHAQYEIRVYADAMLETVRRWVPITFDAFVNYRMGGAHLSATALDVVKRLIAGEPVGQDQSGLSKREWRELMAVLDRDG